MRDRILRLFVVQVLLQSLLLLEGFVALLVQFKQLLVLGLDHGVPILVRGMDHQGEGRKDQAHDED